MEYNSFLFSNYLFKLCSDKSSISCLLAVSSADPITFLSLLLIKSPVQFQSLLKLILSPPCSIGLSNDLWILEAEKWRWTHPALSSSRSPSSWAVGGWKERWCSQGSSYKTGHMCVAGKYPWTSPVLIWFCLMLVASADGVVLHRYHSRFFWGWHQILSDSLPSPPLVLRIPQWKTIGSLFGLASGPGLHPPLLMGYHLTWPGGCLDNPITHPSCYSICALCMMSSKPLRYVPHPLRVLGAWTEAVSTIISLHGIIHYSSFSFWRPFFRNRQTRRKHQSLDSGAFPLPISDCMSGYPKNSVITLWPSLEGNVRAGFRCHCSASIHPGMRW